MLVVSLFAVVVNSSEPRAKREREHDTPEDHATAEHANQLNQEWIPFFDAKGT